MPAVRRRPRHDEDALQFALLMWLQAEHRELYLATIHVPNGGQRGKREGARLKALGVKPGFPDLVCFAPRGHWLGLALELKTGANKPTSQQIKWLARLADYGWLAEWVNSLEGAQEVVRRYAAS